jgi:RHS repeat-associated protein
MPSSVDNHPASDLVRTLLLATDSKSSIVAELAGGRTNSIAYCAYGHQTALQKPATQLGFNGELREKSIGWYLLGKGYRAYNPLLMRFHSPDGWSPFEAGGLNAYMYCNGEPVMGSDPSGHFNPMKWPRNIKRAFKARNYRRVEASPPNPLNATFQQVSDRVNGTVPANTNSAPVSPRVRKNRDRGLPDGYGDHSSPPPPRRDLKKPAQPGFFQGLASNAYGVDGRSSTPAPAQTFSSPGSSGSRPTIQAQSSTAVVPTTYRAQQEDGTILDLRVRWHEDGTKTQSTLDLVDLNETQRRLLEVRRGK